MITIQNDETRQHAAQLHTSIASNHQDNAAFLSKTLVAFYQISQHRSNQRCLKPHEASFMHNCFHHCLRLQGLIMAHTAADTTADENESVLSH